MLVRRQGRILGSSELHGRGIVVEPTVRTVLTSVSTEVTQFDVCHIRGGPAWPYVMWRKTVVKDSKIELWITITKFI